MDKTNRLIAAEIHFLDNTDTDKVINYFKQNNINTVITDYDHLNKKIANALNRNKINLIIRANCNDSLDDIVKKYRPYAVLINEEQLFQTTDKCKIFLESENEILVGSSYDGYILKNIDCDKYLNLKEYTDKPILLHYSDLKMWDNIFYLTNFADVDGAVITDCTNCFDVLPTDIFDKIENLPKFNFLVSNDFCITYPTKDFATYYDGVFITGTGEKSGTVYINGKEYSSQIDGTFGIYYPLEIGENQISIKQNDVEYEFSIDRKKYRNSNSDYELPWDDTIKLEKGTVVRTIGENLTSLLYDKDDDSAIGAGVPAGIPLVVCDSVETQRNGQKTWAYLLQNGMYVLASKVEITDNISPLFEGDRTQRPLYDTINILSIQSEKNKNDEILTFNTTGKTAVTSDFSNDSLTVTFLNSRFENEKMSISDFYNSAQIINGDDSCQVVLELNNDKKLWGYDIQIYDDEVKLYLKSSPEIGMGKNLLSGITVMIDAGHGGYDSGALSVASINGPVEKDLNLATAKALESILKHSGAEVIMTRSDDTFLTLEERRSKIEEYKPDLFIAVHHNSMDYSYNSENAKGSEAYYFTDISKNFADEMCQCVSTSTDRYNRGAQNGYYYVTRTNICPAILMEYSFIINANEYSKTYTNEYIYKSAFGSYMAILKILETKNEI